MNIHEYIEIQVFIVELHIFNVQIHTYMIEVVRIQIWNIKIVECTYNQRYMIALNMHSFNCRDFSDLYGKLSCTITPVSMSLLNCEIYQRGRVSRVADTRYTLKWFADLIIRQMSYALIMNEWTKQNPPPSPRCPGNWVCCPHSTSGCDVRGPQKTVTTHALTCPLKDSCEFI